MPSSIGSCLPVPQAPMEALRGAPFTSSIHSRKCTIRGKICVYGFKEPDRIEPNQGDPFCILEDCSKSPLVQDVFPTEDGTLYNVQLVTSTTPNSGFSQPDVRLRFALIGEDGRAILKQVLTADDKQRSKFKRFQLQRGEAARFKFLGPDLGRLEAMWIGLEAGTWRLEEARVFVASRKKGKRKKHRGVYIFKGTGELLGDGGDALAIELRPSVVVSGEEEGLEQGGKQKELTKQRGMEDYRSLKLLLLSLDAALIVFGAGTLAVAGQRDATLAFLVGGAAGFLYLVLLQRAVDEISPAETGPGSVLKPLVRLAVVLAFVLVAGKAVQGNKIDVASPLKPIQVWGGSAGFFMFRIAVLLASSIKQRD